MPEAATKQVVCAAGDLPAGHVVAAKLGSIPIAVLRAFDGELHALLDRCVHQGARLSGGRLLEATHGNAPGEYHLDADQAILKCPWHGYEYDIRSGCTLFDGRIRVRTFSVWEEDGHVIVATARPRPEDSEHATVPQ